MGDINVLDPNSPIIEAYPKDSKQLYVEMRSEYMRRSFVHALTKPSREQYPDLQDGSIDLQGNFGDPAANLLLETTFFSWLDRTVGERPLAVGAIHYLLSYAMKTARGVDLHFDESMDRSPQLYANINQWVSDYFNFSDFYWSGGKLRVSFPTVTLPPVELPPEYVPPPIQPGPGGTWTLTIINYIMSRIYALIRDLFHEDYPAWLNIADPIFDCLPVVKDGTLPDGRPKFRLSIDNEGICKYYGSLLQVRGKTLEIDDQVLTQVIKSFIPLLDPIAPIVLTPITTAHFPRQQLSLRLWLDTRNVLTLETKDGLLGLACKLDPHYTNLLRKTSEGLCVSISDIVQELNWSFGQGLSFSSRSFTNGDHTEGGNLSLELWNSNNNLIKFIGDAIAVTKDDVRALFPAGTNSITKTTDELTHDSTYSLKVDPAGTNVITVSSAGVLVSSATILASTAYTFDTPLALTNRAVSLSLWTGTTGVLALSGDNLLSIQSGTLAVRKQDIVSLIAGTISSSDIYSVNAPLSKDGYTFGLTLSDNVHNLLSVVSGKLLAKIPCGKGLLSTDGTLSVMVSPDYRNLLEWSGSRLFVNQDNVDIIVHDRLLPFASSLELLTQDVEHINAILEREITYVLVGGAHNTVTAESLWSFARHIAHEMDNFRIQISGGYVPILDELGDYTYIEVNVLDINGDPIPALAADGVSVLVIDGVTQYQKRTALNTTEYTTHVKIPGHEVRITALESKVSVDLPQYIDKQVSDLGKQFKNATDAIDQLLKDMKALQAAWLLFGDGLDEFRARVGIGAMPATTTFYQLFLDLKDYTYLAIGSILPRLDTIEPKLVPRGDEFGYHSIEISSQGIRVKIPSFTNAAAIRGTPDGMVTNWGYAVNGTNGMYLSNNATGLIAPPVWSIGLGRYWTYNERAALDVGPWIKCRPDGGVRITTEGLDIPRPSNSGLEWVTGDTGGFRLKLDNETFELASNDLHLRANSTGGIGFTSTGIKVKLKDTFLACDGDGLYRNLDTDNLLSTFSDEVYCKTGFSQPFPLVPFSIGGWNVNGDHLEYLYNGTWYQNDSPLPYRTQTTTYNTTGIIGSVGLIKRAVESTWNNANFPGKPDSRPVVFWEARAYYWQNTGRSRRVTVCCNFSSYTINDDGTDSPNGWGMLFEQYNYNPTITGSGPLFKRARGIPGPVPEPYRRGIQGVNYTPYTVQVTSQNSVECTFNWAASNYLVIRVDNKSGWHMGLRNCSIEFVFD
jgi:uncharacterized membrane protein (UPF0136 family)